VRHYSIRGTMKETKRKDQNLNFENSILIQEYLLDCNTKGTRYTKKSHLKKFFESVDRNPDEYFIKTKLIDEYEKDIRSFFIKLQQNRTNNSIRGTLATVRDFFEEQEIDISNRIWKKVKNHKGTGTGTVTKDIIPTQEQLKQILEYGDTRLKATCLMLSSSGMRPDELVHLTNDMIPDLNEKPKKPRLQINIPASISKTKKYRTTFISTEATKFLHNWLDVKQRTLEYTDEDGHKQKKTVECSLRDQYINYCISKANIPGHKPKNDDRIFPFSTVSLRRMWNEALNKSGFSKRDTATVQKYHQYHLYTLRKYFRTYGSLSGNSDAFEQMMGHDSPHGYRNIPDDKLLEKYIEGEKDLLVFDNITIIKEPDNEVLKQQETRIEQLETTLQDAMKTIDILMKSTHGD